MCLPFCYCALMKIIKETIPYQNQQTNIFYFLPEANEEIKSTWAIFTHGYTADKSSILNWPIRLAEVGVPCALFDIPGHYLGNFSEVEDFEVFKTDAPKLFLSAFKGLQRHFKDEFPLNEHQTAPGELKLVLGGHSLGGLLSLKAMELPEFKDYEKHNVNVGLGMAPKDVVHIFDTPFYKSTLKIREQLVSPALHPDVVFPWIKEEKEEIEISGQKIHLIVGVDDLVVGEDGMERMVDSLKAKGNVVTFEKPTKLPHHEPQLAAAHVKKYLKSINWI